jgi:hypothetical protein
MQGQMYLLPMGVDYLRVTENGICVTIILNGLTGFVYQKHERMDFH